MELSPVKTSIELSSAELCHLLSFIDEHHMEGNTKTLVAATMEKLQKELEVYVQHNLSN